MRRFGANALLWIACSLGLEMPASATIPVPIRQLHARRRKHLDRLPPVAPWGEGSDRSLWPEPEGPCVLLLGAKFAQAQEDG